MKREKMDFRIATADDRALINRIASEIWAHTYSHMMSGEQLDYMFEMMYAPENLLKAMTEDGQTFLIFSDGAKDIGYISYQTLAGNDFYLQKIYLLPSLQGRGDGRRMLEMLLAHLREVNPDAARLRLNVNRDNTRAIEFYRRNGFDIIGRRDHHVGNGFYMNDYILERGI